MIFNQNYTDKSFVVSGSTKEFKDQLMTLGGRYNPNLKTGPGYIFSNKKEQEVKDFINNKSSSSTDKDILSIDQDTTNKTNKINTTNKINMKSPLPSTSSSFNYPNRFIGSDGLSYQIIITTCPLPFLNQKVTVKYADSSFDCVVSNINDGSVINDIILTYQENDITKQTRAIILNTKWQLYLFDINHEIIFHQSTNLRSGEMERDAVVSYESKTL